MKALQISNFLIAAALFFGLSAVWGGCQSESKPGQAQNAAEKTDKLPGTGGKDKVVLEGDGLRTEIDPNAREWPADIPAAVPEFALSGGVEQVLKGENPEGRSWTIQFKDVRPNALTEYEQLLKKAGFTTMKMTASDKGALTGRRAGGLMVTLALTEEEKAMLSIVEPKRPE